MNRPRAWKPMVLSCVLLAAVGGCAAGPSEVGLCQEEDKVSHSARQPPVAKRSADQSGAVVQTAYFEPSQAPPPSPPNGKAEKIKVQPSDTPLRQPRRIVPEAVPDAADASVDAVPLVLEEVVTSVATNFPLLLAAIEEEGITTGQLLAAQGAFDLNLRGREFWQSGTYESNRVNLGVDQNLAWNGWSYFAGYRQSNGDFPIYYGDRKTGDGGEFRAGVLIPLLAGRAIDRRRATLRQAAIARQMADPAIAAQRLDFVRAASRAYWTWIATGHRRQIAQSVLTIAQDRDTQLTELVQRGAVAEIERMDNQRVIVERQARLIATERAWQQASIALSLYLRDPNGEPQTPGATRLPDDLPEPQPIDLKQVDADIQLALQHRPELKRLRLQRQRTAVDLQLARNQTLPGLNVGLEAYQDVGYESSFSKTPLVSGTELDRTAYLASLQFDVPLRQREATGRAVTAQHTLAQLAFQERFQRDRIAAELQDAASALERSYELLKKARENVSLARKVESGERERFAKGQGTIVILNLRELVTAEAAFAEVDALAEFHRSLADYKAATGLDHPLL